MNLKLLKLLSKNARYTVRDLSVMTGLSDDEVRTQISEMEKDKR